MFDDTAVTRNHEALRNNVLPADRLDQRTRKAAVIPNYLVIDSLRAIEILNVVLTLIFVISGFHPELDQPARLVFVVHLHLFRHFKVVWPTPGGPVVYLQ